jgi:hypothetical protein
MSYHTDIYDAILASAALAAVIGDRFSWDVADGDTLAPYLVGQTVSGNGQTCHDGSRELEFPLVQFTAWAPTKVEALNLMRVFQQELEGIELPGASNTSLSYAGEQSTRDPQTKLFGEIRDYRISSTIT